MKIVFQATINGPITNMRWQQDSYVLQANEYVLNALAIPVLDVYAIWDGTAIVENTAQQSTDQANAAQMAYDIGTDMPTWDQINAVFTKAQADINAAATLAAVKPILLNLVTIMQKMARVEYWLAVGKQT